MTATVASTQLVNGLGAAAITTRGFGLEQIDFVADVIDRAVKANGDEAKIKALRTEVADLCGKYPLFQMD